MHRPWKADPQEFKYIGKSTYAPNVPLPKPPKLLTAGTPAAKAAEANMQAAAAAGSNNGCGKFMPPTWPNAPLWNAECVIQEAEDSEHGPHKLLRRLNGGYLPYTVLSRKVGKTTKVSCLPSGMDIAGEWVSAGCARGGRLCCLAMPWAVQAVLE